MNDQEVINHLKSLANPTIAEHSQRFFKTAKGEYGYGDIFLGIRVPVIRKAVKQYKNASLNTALKLLQSSYHEVRMFALLLLVSQFPKAEAQGQEKIYRLYLTNTRFINNWDLVDCSAHFIVGAYLFDRDRDILYQLCRSELLWERRIAVMATFYFIRRDDYSDLLKLAKLLLDDQQDLIHKAVGWMLREVGKRNLNAEVKFLNQHFQAMPRTMLRYAIEKFSQTDRLKYLNG
ncbi:MAG: DNA alkylation repair protein [Gammaproteobacteria bacterium]|nr:DNA alkylation repair protein [Gammaproteobacteria bacterium]